ncbi:hypothetical protein CDAR_531601 [Caerostris darwini]|uniref:Uncharacterized protein n=1 Tax=Caerostris darwini TaxID=1538125 RepID=A0AAV4QXH9_9ARAC|nr:hypothetical protein CDAR_531601 [Caerostris darwini]
MWYTQAKPTSSTRTALPQHGNHPKSQGVESLRGFSKQQHRRVNHRNTSASRLARSLTSTAIRFQQSTTTQRRQNTRSYLFVLQTLFPTQGITLRGEEPHSKCQPKIACMRAFTCHTLLLSRDNSAYRKLTLTAILFCSIVNIEVTCFSK